MSFLTRQRWIFLLAALIAIAAPGITYAQLDLKGKAVETLTNGVMKELDKKFTEMIAKEALSAAVKANIVKNLSEMSRPIVKNFIDGASSGKLPNVTEVVNSVMRDVTPRVQELVKVALTDGGAGSVAQVAGQAPTTASALSAASASTAVVGYDDEKDFTVEILKESNSVRITKYNGKNTELKIPPRIGEHPVTEIGERAFVKKGLVSVVIPESVIFIGNLAFADNQIGTVSIGANVYIANNAFENTGYNSFSAGYYNSQGRTAGTYSNSWRKVSAASPQPAVQPAAQTTIVKQTAANNSIKSGSTVIFAENGHKYEVIGKSLPWKNARDDCEKRGGYLATITSKEEQKFIQSLLKKKGDNNWFWLGGYREGKDWQWVTGESFTFTNWNTGEPSGGGEDKLMLFKNGLWNDLSNGNYSNIAGYICEWDAD
jgi:hypothetical protein